MITEDYVSFMTAKLLKKKGFNETCRAFYYKDCLYEINKLSIFDKCTNSLFTVVYKDYEHISQYIAAPTLQMAIKWLREVHHIFIRVIQSHIEYCMCEIYYDVVRYHQFRESFNSYEEACEMAIKYCLKNLI